MKIGAQMYTVRDFCKTTEDLAETLKKIADIGYKTVQVSGTCSFDAEWMKDELEKNGLECVLTHTAPARVSGETVKVAEEHKVFGCKNVGIGSFPEWDPMSEEKFEAFVSKYLPAAKTLNENGCYFMYHNHAFEFLNKVGDKTLMQALIDSFPADLMGFTLDTHWVKVGGEDPVEYLKLLKGRTPCVHFKDLVYDSENKPLFAPVGSGVLDFDSIIKTCIDLGIEYALVEQDNCYGEDPFACLKKSYDYLTSMGLN